MGSEMCIRDRYIHFLAEAYRLLSVGGILLSDNVLQDGDVLESRFAVTRRNRTIHARMREYLYELTHHPMLETAILQVGDGVAISVRKEENACGEGKVRGEGKVCGEGNTEKKGNTDGK